MEDKYITLAVFHNVSENPDDIISSCKGLIVSDKEEDKSVFVDLEPRIRREYENGERKYFKLAKRNLEETLRECEYETISQVLLTNQGRPIMDEMNKNGNVLDDSHIYRLSKEISRITGRIFSEEDVEEFLNYSRSIVKSIVRRNTDIYQTVDDFAYYEYNKLERDPRLNVLGYWTEITEAISDYELFPFLVPKSDNPVNRNIKTSSCRVSDLDLREMRMRAKKSFDDFTTDAMIVNGNWITYNSEDDSQREEWVNKFSHYCQNSSVKSCVTVYRCSYIGSRIVDRDNKKNINRGESQKLFF